MWQRRQQQRQPAEHLEIVPIDGTDSIALPCNCPRAEDHGRVNSRTFAGAPVAATAGPRHRAYA